MSATNACRNTGSLSRSSARTICSATPPATMRHGTPRRFSLMSHATASSADEAERALNRQRHASVLHERSAQARRHSVTPPGLSSSTMPASSSSLRMRSASAKFFDLLAAARAAMSSSIVFVQRSPGRVVRRVSGSDDLTGRAGRTIAAASLAEMHGILLQQPQHAAQRLQRAASAGERDRFSSFAISNNTAIASGVLKSSSIASLKRCARGSLQSMSRPAHRHPSAPCRAASAPGAHLRGADPNS